MISLGVPGTTRTYDPRFRKSPLTVTVTLGYGTDGQLVAAATGLILATARDDAEAANAFRLQLGALAVASMTQALELAERIVAAHQASTGESEVGS